MSKRAIEFVDNWIARRIHSETYLDTEYDDPLPKALADQCAAEAAVAGISRREIDEEGGDLELRMADAINAVASSGLHP